MQETEATDWSKRISETTEYAATVLHNIWIDFDINKRTGWWRIDEILDDLPAHQVRIAKDGEEKSFAFSHLICERLRENNFKRLRALYPDHVSDP
jgi:hypothetical protein